MGKTSSSESKRVVIIGGGITGSGAAWHLQKVTGNQIDVSLLEKTHRWGGKVITQVVAAQTGGVFTNSAGPESFITRKPKVWEMVQDLGIADQMIDPGSETREIFILVGENPFLFH